MTNMEYNEGIAKSWATAGSFIIRNKQKIL